MNRGRKTGMKDVLGRNICVGDTILIDVTDSPDKRLSSQTGVIREVLKSARSGIAFWCHGVEGDKQSAIEFKQPLGSTLGEVLLV